MAQISKPIKVKVKYCHYGLVGSASAWVGKDVMSSIPSSVKYISYPMFIEPTDTWVPLGFSGYIRVDTKIVLKKIHSRTFLYH